MRHSSFYRSAGYSLLPQTGKRCLTAMAATPPSLLKGIGATVQEVYQGKVPAFLSAADLVIPSLFRAGIEQVLQRLTPSENLILCWLAIAHGPVAIDTLMAKMVPPPRAMAIQSLVSRGLCYPVNDGAKADTELTLACMVQVIVLAQLRPLLLQELLENRFDRLNRLPLVTVTAQEGIQEAAAHDCAGSPGR